MDNTAPDFQALKARILKRSHKSGECVIWVGAHDALGFGRIYTSAGVRSVHRIVFAADHDGVDDGMLVYHTCGNRDCVRSDHLYEAPLPEPQPRQRKAMPLETRLRLAELRESRRK